MPYFYYYHYEFRTPDGFAVISCEFRTIEECVKECKKACLSCGVDYDDRDVKLFLTDSDGTEECTEEGELAG